MRKKMTVPEVIQRPILTVANLDSVKEVRNE